MCRLHSRPSHKMPHWLLSRRLHLHQCLRQQGLATCRPHQQQNLAMVLQPKSPTEVLANRVPHANGVTWVFHDLATGFVRHVNVPNIPLVPQQQPSQRIVQSSHGNEMVLYQSPSNQPPQQVAQIASAAQSMTTPNVQPASASLPMTLPAPQAASTDGQQIE